MTAAPSSWPDLDPAIFFSAADPLLFRIVVREFADAARQALLMTIKLAYFNLGPRG
jgi:hypothetical protein